MNAADAIICGVGFGLLRPITSTRVGAVVVGAVCGAAALEATISIMLSRLDLDLRDLVVMVVGAVVGGLIGSGAYDDTR